MRVDDWLLTHPAAQIRMHHIPLDGAGSDERNTHDQVGEAARLQPGQHLRLCPTFHLEDTHRVHRTDQIIDGGIIKCPIPRVILLNSNQDESYEW